MLNIFVGVRFLCDIKSLDGLMFIMKTIVQHRFNSENQPSLDTFLKEIISRPTHNRLHDVYNIPGLCIAAQLKKNKTNAN